MRRRQQQVFYSLTGNVVLVGTIAILVAGIAVMITYNANRGLPFVPTFTVTVDVPDAAELVISDEVRIGGARVGQLSEVRAMPGEDGRPPFARLELKLDEEVRPLPADSRVEVRPRSLLGGKYLALIRGESDEELEPGGQLTLEQANETVELDDAFRIFDDETKRGIRGAVGGLGGGLAGRGRAINIAIGEVNELLPPLQRVVRVLVAPSTDLAGFIDGVAATSSALAAVAPTLGALVENADTTFGALDAASGPLGEAIEELPPTEVVGTRVLVRATPVLDDAAAIARALRPGTRLLPVASSRLASALRAAIPTLREDAGVPVVLESLAGTLETLAGQDDVFGESLRLLTETVTLLDTALDVLGPAQTVCNIGGIWTRNVPSTISEGDDQASWFRGVPITGSTQILQAGEPDPDLHTNPYPNLNASECEYGNEPFVSGEQAIGNPPGNQSTEVDETSPPPGVRELAEQAGLIRRSGGGG